MPLGSDQNTVTCHCWRWWTWQNSVIEDGHKRPGSEESLKICHLSRSRWFWWVKLVPNASRLFVPSARGDSGLASYHVHIFWHDLTHLSCHYQWLCNGWLLVDSRRHLHHDNFSTSNAESLQLQITHPANLQWHCQCHWQALSKLELSSDH